MEDELAFAYMRGGRNMFMQPMFVLELGLSYNVVITLRALFPQKEYDRVHHHEKREYQAQKIIRIVKERTEPLGFTFYNVVMKNGSPINTEPVKTKKSIVFRKHYWTDNKFYHLTLKSIGVGVGFSNDCVGFSASYGFRAGEQSPGKSARKYSDTIISMEKVAAKYPGTERKK